MMWQTIGAWALFIFVIFIAWVVTYSFGYSAGYHHLLDIYTGKTWVKHHKNPFNWCERDSYKGGY